MWFVILLTLHLLPNHSIKFCHSSKLRFWFNYQKRLNLFAPIFFQKAVIKTTNCCKRLEKQDVLPPWRFYQNYGTKALHRFWSLNNLLTCFTFDYLSDATEGLGTSAYSMFFPKVSHRSQSKDLIFPKLNEFWVHFVFLFFPLPNMWFLITYLRSWFIGGPGMTRWYTALQLIYVVLIRAISSGKNDKINEGRIEAMQHQTLPLLTWT